MVKSPFKFLDAYTSADIASFFGRETEERQLFQQLRNTSITLLYGVSGTGKTSLVQCGLAKYYDGPDWHPFYIKRGNNINNSLEALLKSVLDEDTLVESLEGLVYEVFLQYSRPVYLIFDQFEEIFTVAKNTNEAEKELFFTNISQLLKRNLPCKVIFIIREEYLGQLYDFERYIPNLFDFRIRVEPMNTSKLAAVLKGTFGYFKINQEQENSGVQNEIKDNLIEGNATSQLAYLQVYLDRLWKFAYIEKYGEQEWSGVPPNIEITEDTISKVGDVNNVLNIYLEEQLKSIAAKLSYEPEWISEILDSFVTEDGTKRPILEGSNLLNPKNRLNQDALIQCLSALQESRLIRKDNEYFELAHDALAGILDKKRTGEQRLIKGLAFTFKTSYDLYMNPNERGGLLNEENVSLFDRYKEKILEELKQDEQKMLGYLENSRKNNEAKKNLLKRYTFGAIILGFIAIGVAFFAYSNYKEANKNFEAARNNLQKFNKQKALELINEAKTYLKSKDSTNAYYKVLDADSLDPNNPEIKDLLLDLKK